MKVPNHPHQVKDAKVVDLFCGVGALTHGMILEGFQVEAGVDIDAACKYAFETNNSSRFIQRDISKFSSKELKDLFGSTALKILIGCAPCQPFSAINRKGAYRKSPNERWRALRRFIRLIGDVRPHVISMENVPELFDERKFPVMTQLRRSLKRFGYNTTFKVVDASRFGVPQKRKRLVLLA